MRDNVTLQKMIPEFMELANNLCAYVITNVLTKSQ